MTVAASSLDLTLEKRKFLILREHFQRTFTDTAVTRVTRIDSRVEGGIIGFVAGFVPVVLAPCDSHDDGGYCELGKIIFGPLSGALGAGIGMLIDGSINKVVYRTTAPVRPVTITVSPLLKPKSAGASLSLRF